VSRRAIACFFFSYVVVVRAVGRELCMQRPAEADAVRTVRRTGCILAKLATLLLASITASCGQGTACRDPLIFIRKVCAVLSARTHA
jgi:hypothetical protein